MTIRPTTEPSKLSATEPGETRVLIDITGADAKTVWVGSKDVNIIYPKLKIVQVLDIGDNAVCCDKFLLLGFGATSS